MSKRWLPALGDAVDKRDSLQILHKQLCDRARELMEKKNVDYATSADPFKNFRRHGLRGMVVRMDDKLARMTNYIDNGGFAVEDESVEDLVLDLINYAVLAYGYALDETGDL
jgi:hypothetical protein